MSKQWVRQEIKRNEIALFLEKSFNFYQKKRETIILSIGIGVIGIAVIVYFIVQYSSLNVRAWDQLMRAQATARSGNLAQAENELKTIIQNYRRTPASIHALFVLGEVYLFNKDYQKASEIYQQCIDSYHNNTLIPFSYIGLGTSLQEMGNLSKAIEVYLSFSKKYAYHFLYPSVLNALAYCYDKTDQAALAREYYEKMITMYPKSLWAEYSYTWLALLDQKTKQTLPEAKK